ncbi:MAG TPA: saccharopine dehydrogenase C-terminal domain-containing protein, partial [Polyangiaceae bacterium]|nr:saccharopine dehydrogenase C-terminal domain-containing protein [Polyangiaceae bacterium]
DVDDDSLSRLGKTSAQAVAAGRLETVRLDATQPAELARALEGQECVISALSYHHNPLVAEAALKAGASYFDLTEDVETTRRIREIAARAKPGQVFMPQCGLAPGFVSVAAYELTRGFDRLDRVFMRVGALPQFPTNALKYNLTWSTDGLINEYCNPCEAIHRGKRIEVLALEGLEQFSIDGIRYEAFNTSGGLGTLCETLDGKVSELNYKTIRYQGHREYATFLVNELRLGDQRKLFKDLLEGAIPITFQDVVVVFCTVSGWRDGQLVQITDARKIYNDTLLGENWSAIQITTAAGVCTMIDLHFQGRLGRDLAGRGLSGGGGFACQEQVGLAEFLDNRFGRVYGKGSGDRPVPEFSGSVT